MDETTSNMLTIAIVKWEATYFRPMNIERDAAGIFQSIISLRSRGTIVARIQALYETKKATELELLKKSLLLFDSHSRHSLKYIVNMGLKTALKCKIMEF